MKCEHCERMAVAGQTECEHCIAELHAMDPPDDWEECEYCGALGFEIEMGLRGCAECIEVFEHLIQPLDEAAQ